MPYQFQPVAPGTPLEQALAVYNENFAKLDAQTVTNTFTQPGGNAIVFGRYANNRYGLLIYDINGIPSELLGQAPDDGRPGHWIAKPGQNVLTLLGG